jgi:transposase
LVYVALDLGKENIIGVAIDRKGRVIKQAKFNNKNEALDSFFADIGKAKVVIEACYGWEPVYDKLSENHDVILAHPKEIKAIAKAKIKNDKVDSLILARLLRADLIPQAYAPSKEIRELRSRCRNRAFLVSLKTRLLNKIRAEVARRNIELPTKCLGKRARKYLEQLNISVINRSLLLVEEIEKQIEDSSEEIIFQAKNLREVEILRSIGGIDYFLALGISSEIADINRFSTSEKLCCYAGLVPRLRQSGIKERKGKLIVDCNRWLRWYLIQASWSHLKTRQQSFLKEHYKKILRRTKNKQKAIAALARKLCKVIWWMLKFEKRFVSNGLNYAYKNLGHNTADKTA